MSNNQKGFANLVLIGALIVVIAIGGYFLVSKKSSLVVKKEIPQSPKICKQDQNATPEIYSLSTNSFSVGDTIKINGCNLAGFEGDDNVWLQNTNGIKGILYGARHGDNENIEITTTSFICEQDTSYSGEDCKNRLTLVPGVYKLYAMPWGKKSNEVSVTIK